MSLKAFFLQHPGIIKAIEGLEHAGLDGAEELVLAAVGAKFGLLSRLLPVESIANHVKQSVESAIDGELEQLITPDAPPAPVPAVPGDPRMAAAQSRRRAQLAEVQNPNANEHPADVARDEQAANPGT